MHRHKHPNKRTLSTHTHTHVKETNLSGERHFVMCPYEHQHSHTYVKTCLSETLAGRCCPRENCGFSLVVSRPDHTLFSPSSDCACYFKMTGHWRCLAEVILSQFFGPSPGFSELFGGRLLPWWESFPGTGREMLEPAWIPKRRKKGYKSWHVQLCAFQTGHENEDDCSKTHHFLTLVFADDSCCDEESAGTARAKFNRL